MRDVAVTCGSPRTERRPASLADGYSFYRWPGATDGPEQPSGLKTRTVEAANFSCPFRKFHPTWIRIARKNHRMNWSRAALLFVRFRGQSGPRFGQYQLRFEE